MTTRERPPREAISREAISREAILREAISREAISREPAESTLPESPESPLIPLSRLTITGRVTESTPLVVLREIADAHGIRLNPENLKDRRYIRNIIDEIYNQTVVAVKIPFRRMDYQYIARFVNNSCDWPVESLTEAFNHLQRFMIPLPERESSGTGGSGGSGGSGGEQRSSGLGEGEIELPTTFLIGLQTPAQPHSLNACVLYRLCRRYRIMTTHNTTLDQMAMAIRLLAYPLDTLHKTLTSRFDDVTKSALINTLLQLPDFANLTLTTPLEATSAGLRVPELVTHASLEAAHAGFRDVQRAYRRFTPTTASEAIVLAAINHKIDISLARSPREEYTLLHHSPYVPRDASLKTRYDLNPELLSLTTHFNPNLPPTLYAEEDLRLLASREGYSPSDFSQSNPYELLQISHLVNTFHHGKREDMMNAVTPITLDLLGSLPNGVVVCYGCATDGSNSGPAPRGTGGIGGNGMSISRSLGQSSGNSNSNNGNSSGRAGNIVAYRYSELAEAFTQARNFSNPLSRSGEVFESRAIKKLKILCGVSHPGDTPEMVAERQQLQEAITEVELFSSDQSDRARELHGAYIRANSRFKELIRRAITHLFELAMSMRGWLGIGPFPIRNSEAVVTNQVAVDLQVTAAISRFEASCTELGRIGQLILGLPLLRYRGAFQASTEARDGLTIGDRLRLVKQGDTVSNMGSCIRMSSNWFSASAHRYMHVIGMTPPFDIERLEHIS